MIKIVKSEQIPIYQQIINSVTEGIEQGVLKENEQLPSVNTIIKEFGIARQTLVKAFRILQERGIITAVQGKGYYISTASPSIKHRVFILFDTFASYKEVLYGAIKRQFGENAELDIYFHHYNDRLFTKLLNDASGHYTSYLILSYSFDGLNKALDLIPKEKLYLLDIEPDKLLQRHCGVFQDFYNDMTATLNKIRKNIEKYNSVTMVNHYNISMVPSGILNAFGSFCEKNGVNGKVINSLKGRRMKKGEGYIVFDDEDLVFLIEQAEKNKLKIGSELGIISYNETSLKKVVAGGISVISTDFDQLGVDVVNMILEEKKEHKYNPCEYIERGSF